MAAAAAGASVLATPALAAGSSGSGGATPGSQGVLIGDKLYSGVLITLENCLLPDDKLRFTPSMSSGLDSDTETGLRVVGCELIQAAGILLRLPQVAMATGQVLFQRFFYTKSFVKHSMEHVSMACVHLASKIEEAPRRIRDVINVFHRLRHLREKKKPVPLVLDQEYVNLKNQIIKAERRVLKELGFCVHVKHPHKIIVMYLQVLECERNQHLVQTAWNYMNDSLRTDVFVRFQPESIACACIYLAARTLEIPLPNRPHWFLLFGATEEEIQEICFKILQLYTRKKVDLTHLESEVEKRKQAIGEAKARARGLLPGSAPVLGSAAGFSPASKLGSVESPKEGKGNKSSPVSVKNAKRKVEGPKKAKADSPVNGLPKGHESRSQSRSREQSYSRSPSRSASPKRRKSDSGSTSGGSKSQSRSRSRSDSPPRQVHRGAPYKGSEVRASRKAKDCKYLTQKPHKSRSRSSSRSRSRSRERTDNSGKYKKKSHYYRDQRRERSRSYERTGHRYERDHPAHSRHRSSEHLCPGHPLTMFLARLTSQLVRAVPWAGFCRSWPSSGVTSSHAFRPLYSLQSASLTRAASLPGKGAQLELEEFLVPRKMSISPLESWLTARYLLPKLDVGVPMTVVPSRFHKCPPSQEEEEAKQGVRDATPMQCKNVLKIRRRKMNHHKYRKLIKRTRFQRRKVREGRLKRKQIKFEKELKRIWLKAGLKEAPESWQTPKIYMKNK